MVWQTSTNSGGKPDDLPIQSLPDDAEMGTDEEVDGAGLGLPDDGIEGAAVLKAKETEAGSVGKMSVFSILPEIQRCIREMYS
jgi:hypothetical protein